MNMIQASQELLKVSRVLVASKALRAGTTTRVIRGSGWTEKEALDDAMKSDREEYGHGDGYGGGYGSVREILKTKMVVAPKKPTKVILEKFTVKKGPVKKGYVIERRFDYDRSPIERNSNFNKTYETQGAALSAAKPLALEYGETLVITLKAFCVGDTRLAVIKPGPSQIGKWEFKVDFRE